LILFRTWPSIRLGFLLCYEQTGQYQQEQNMAAMLIRGHGATVSSTSAALVQFTRRVSSRQLQIVPYFSLSSSKPITSSQHVIPLITSHRHISSTSYKLRNTDEGQSSTAELHSLYHDQMKEIQSEREEIFGTTASDDASDSPDLSQAAKSYFSSKENAEQPSSSSSKPTTSPPPIPPSGWNAEEAEEAYAERESLYAFTEEEKSGWSNNNGAGINIHRIRELMREHDKTTEAVNTPPPTSSPTPSPFSHLTPQGDGVSMVDVGHKTITRRVALARSVVVFPPEVLSAFKMNGSNSEMIGPKGPIFETAKIAGIMGAKKTSDLIPLCHPLPLDRVNINIQLINNQAIIECECTVTHKTGVEMEALTGATIAALTIYDMVKAVSHRVEIGQTVLVSKSGGKSGDFAHN